MSFTITGTLHKKFDTEEKSGSFKSRDFVLLLAGQYPQFIKFQLVQDRTGIIDQVREGQTITVSFDLRGREHDGKFYTNLQAWRIETDQSAATQTAPAQTQTEDTPF